MAGDVLLFNMYILHGSFENYSKKEKLELHVMFDFNQNQWIKTQDILVRILLVPQDLSMEN